MEEYGQSLRSTPWSSDNKRCWDTLKEYADCNQPPADNKRTCTEWSSLLETKPNSAMTLPFLCLPESSEGLVYNPVIENSNPLDILGGFGPHTGYQCTPVEDIGQIDGPPPFLPNLSWPASNAVPPEAVRDQNPADAVASVNDGAFTYFLSQEQLVMPSGTSIGAWQSGAEVKIETAPILAQHDQNEPMFRYETYPSPTIRVQDGENYLSLPDQVDSVSPFLLSPSTGFWQMVSDSISPAQCGESQESALGLELLEHGLHDLQAAGKPNGSSSPGNMAHVSLQSTSTPDVFGFRSLGSEDISVSVPCVKEKYGPKQLGKFNLQTWNLHTLIIDVLGVESACKGSSPTEVVHQSLEEPYDTCFGMVVAKAFSSTSIDERTSCVPVTIRICGSLLKLYFEASNTYAGLIEAPTLSKLVQSFSVTLAATLTAPQRKEKKCESIPWKERTVHIAIYGLLREMDAVGNFLSDDGHYLQHPSEYDTRVDYVNPQYLVRPGSQMPRLDGVTFTTVSKFSSCKEILNENVTNQLLHVFDSANGPNMFSEIRPSPRLRTCLQDHQMKALAMMTEKESGVLEGANFNTLWEVSTNLDGTKSYRHTITGSAQNAHPTPVYGGLLADEMGLGKTLSVLALIAWFLDTLDNASLSQQASTPHTTLIVSPKSTIPGWQQQIIDHIHPGQIRVALYHGSNRRGRLSGLFDHDIVLTNYDTLRSEWTGRARDGLLYSKEWARIVLDEAHHIRNRSSKIFEAACAIRARYRWCLTGTPIHNRLDDYGALLSFLGVPPFTSKALFDYWVTTPINKTNSEGVRRLKKLVMATCLRRTKNAINNQLQLPQRIDREEAIELDMAERELYDFFKVRTSSLVAGMFSKDTWSSPHQQRNILPLINFLRRICDHGEELLPPAALEVWLSWDSSAIDWKMMGSCVSKCDSCKADIDNLLSPDSYRSEFSCLHVICPKCTITNDEDDSTVDANLCPVCNRESIPSVSDRLTGSTSNEIDVMTVDYRPSSKVKALLANLREEQRLNIFDLKENPIKSVVFSFWTKMLDLIEIALRKNGFVFQRIDGQTSLEHRIRALNAFKTEYTCTVMLASIGSIGEGVDLTAANYVHLVEPHWNPMVEAQALDRVHRIGQKRDVVTVRYITNNSIETYVREIQQQKLRLIQLSLGDSAPAQSEVDEARWERLFAALK